MKLKRIICIVVIIATVFSMGFNTFAEKDTRFVNYVANSKKAFENWKGKKISDAIPLYDKNLNINAYLYHIGNDKSGYFIMDVNNDKILQIK